MPFPFIAAAIVLALAVLVPAFWPVIRRRPSVGGVLVGAALLVATSLYLLVGTPAALDASRVRAPDTLADAVGRLEAELARNPAQPEGWRLLADAYRAENRPADAARALARAASLAPQDADLLVQAAEGRALADPKRRFDADAIAMLKRALAVQPAHQRARWFLGVAQRQRGDAAGAAATWQPLLATVDPATSNALRTQIDAARREAGLPALTDTDVPKPRALTVAVSIEPALAATLPRDAAVFVLARDPGGPPMPVAARRLTLADLPTRITLGDADSPMPTRRLSQLERVEVLARLSQTGVANAQAGDLESAPAVVAADGKVDVVIDRVRR